MPRRNTIKQYIENGYYHVYNRGVDKRIIFQDDQDYRVFLAYLKALLSQTVDETNHPLLDVTGFNPVRSVRFRPIETLYGKVELLAYCLMPNHFHLLIKQIDATGMSQLVKRLITSYSMYFNKKYARSGHLFEGIYKAASIDEESYLLHVSRYIHLNPDGLTGFNPVSDPVSEYPYSSYAYYLGKKNAEWLNTEMILSFFKTKEKNPLLLKDFLSYESFVEDFKEDPASAIGTLALE